MYVPMTEKEIAGWNTYFDSLEIDDSELV